MAAPHDDADCAAVTLDDFVGGVAAMVAPPGGMGDGVHMAAVGVTVSQTPVEVMVGRGGDNVHGVRVDLGAHMPCAVVAQAVNTPDGCHGVVNLGVPNKWRLDVAWDTEAVPHSCETMVKLGSMTGAVSWFGGLGPYGLVLSGARHLTLATRFNSGGYGSTRFGWRLLSDGSVSDVGVLYDVVPQQLPCLKDVLGLDRVYATAVGAPFCSSASTAKLKAGVKLQRLATTFALLTSTSSDAPAFQGKPATQAALDVPLAPLKGLSCFTGTPRAIIRGGAAHDGSAWSLGGLVSLDTPALALSVGVEWISAAAPTLAVQARFL